MIRIVGDCNFADGYFDTGFGIGSAIQAGNVDPFAGLNISPTDYYIGNFECVASSVSDNEGIQKKYFRITPNVLHNFRHLNLYGVANNHVMQHGPNAYSEMLDTIENLGSAYVGSNNRRSYIFKHQGKQIAVIAFNQRPENFSDRPSYWALPDYKDIEAELFKVRDADFRIIFVHWGNEFIEYPYNDQIQFAHFLIDSGADLVAGMHPHVLQGMEVYNNKHIFYSLGNCLFRMAWEPTTYSIRINIDLATDVPTISYDYIRIDADTSFPRIVSEVPEEYSIPVLSKKISLHRENELYYAHVTSRAAQYRKANRLRFLRDMIRLKPIVLCSMLKEFIQRRLS